MGPESAEYAIEQSPLTMRNPYVSRSGVCSTGIANDLQRPDADRLPLRADFVGLQSRPRPRPPTRRRRPSPPSSPPGRRPAAAARARRRTAGVEAERRGRPVVGVQVADEDRRQLVRRAMLEQARECARAGVDPDAGVILLDEVARAGGTGGGYPPTRAEYCQRIHEDSSRRRSERRRPPRIKQAREQRDERDRAEDDQRVRAQDASFARMLPASWRARRAGRDAPA